MKDLIQEGRKIQETFKNNLNETIEKPKGKVYIKATGANRYMGGDSNWHLITGYEYEKGLTGSQPKDVKEIRATFTWKGERNGIGVSLYSDGGEWLHNPSKRDEMNQIYKKLGLNPPPPGPNLVAKKDSSSGQPITLQQAYKIITGT